MNFKIIGLMLSLFAILGCSVEKNTQLSTATFWISGYKSECDSGAEMGKCLLLTNSNNLAEAVWEKFHSPIAGFVFEPGYLQQIKVKASTLKKRVKVSDRSSLNYKMIKVVEKKSDTRLELQGEWTLNKINGSAVKTGDPVMHVAIDLYKNQFSGYNGCTYFSGVITNVTTDKLNFKNVRSTLSDCNNLPHTADFNVAMNDIYRFKVLDNALSFYNRENQEILSFTQKQTPQAEMRIHDIYVAVSIGGESIVRRKEMPRLELNLNTMEVFGNNGCNEFTGKITAVSANSIAFAGITSTRKMCKDMVLPEQFHHALQNAVGYKFEDLHLTFYDANGKELIIFLKVD
jgi:heat shock protein HslJ